MSVLNTSADMELCDLSGPVTVTIMYDDSDEDTLANNDDIIAVHTEKEIEKKKPKYSTKTSDNEFVRLVGKHSNYTNKTDREKGKHKKSKKSKHKSKSIESSDNYLEKITDDEVSSPPRSPKKIILNAHEAKAVTNVKTDVIVNELLYSVCKSLIHIVNAHNKLTEIVNEKSDIEIGKQELKRQYAKIKYHFFQLSYCTTVSIILKLNNADVFKKAFLKSTMNIAKEDMNLNLTIKEIMPFYDEMLLWAKQKKDWILNLPVKNPFILSNITKKNKEIVNTTALQINDKVCAETNKKDNAKPMDAQQTVSNLQSCCLSSSKEIQYQNEKSNSKKGFLPEINFFNSNKNIVSQVIPNSVIVSTEKLQKEPIAQEVTHNDLNKIDLQIVSQDTLDSGASEGMHLNDYIDGVDKRNQNRLEHRTETNNSNERQTEPASYNIQHIDTNSISTDVYNKTFSSHIKYPNKCVTIGASLIGKKKYQGSYHPYQEFLRNEPTPTVYERFPSRRGTSLGHEVVSSSQESAPFRIDHVPNYSNCNYNILRYHLNNDITQSYNPVKCDTYLSESYEQDSSVGTTQINYEPVMPISLPIQNERYFSEKNRPPNIIPEKTHHIIPHLQNKVKMSIQRSQSSISTDGEYISPPTFSMVEETDNTLQMAPMITHVTSLNPKALRIKNGQCRVCGVLTRKMCLACYQFYYCSYDCMKKDWIYHMPLCKNDKGKQNTSTYVAT